MTSENKKKTKKDIEEMKETRRRVMDRINEGVDLDPEEILKDSQAIKELTEAINAEDERKSKGQQIFDEYGKPVLGFLGGAAVTIGMMSFVMSFEKYDVFSKTGNNLVGKMIAAYAKTNKLL